MHYNRFRYYDGDVGMFIQRDPIGLLGGVNVFAYAPNPVGWVDPWGLARTINTGTTSCKLNGLAKFQEHHIISDKNIKTKNHPLLVAAGGIGILQESRNKVMLPTDPSYHKTKSVHCGRHDQAVSNNLANAMTKVHNLGKSQNWSQNQYKQALYKIMDNERSLLNSGVRALNRNRRLWSVPLPGQLK